MLLELPKSPRFALGTVYVTAGVLNSILLPYVAVGLERYATGHWGLVDSQTAKRNNSAGRDKRGVYEDLNRRKFVIRTDASSLGTVISLPSEQ
jgi:hypothetical protein